MTDRLTIGDRVSEATVEEGTNMEEHGTSIRTEADRELRERAVERLRKKSELRAHALAYVLVNGFLVIIWALTGASFFWPAFPIAGWGIGLVFHAWDVYRRQEFSEEQIQHEIQRL